MKNCNTCNIIKPFDVFELRSDTGKYRNICKMCCDNKYKIDICYQTKTKVCIQCDVKKSFDCFSEKKYKNGTVALMVKCKECLIKNKVQRSSENHKKWKDKPSSKLKVRVNNNKYARKQRIISPEFKIRQNFSRSIRSSLLKNDKIKDDSFLKYLPYTIKDLKQHLESQFEPWMTWRNYGKYNKQTWDDQDSSTWTWQIDHIVPHSIFKYKSMNEDNFKKCWSLENLRPLNAKQNILDGVNLVRHVG